VDNASTDDTKAVVDEYKQANIKIRYVYEPVPGAARARKKGLESALGDILVGWTTIVLPMKPGWSDCQSIFIGYTGGYRRWPGHYRLGNQTPKLAA